MSPTIISITNQKGGVGKTTTACALLSSLHNRGAKVLGVDLDPQGSLSFSLGLDIEHCVTIYDVFRGTASPEQAVSPTDTCDLLPANILLSAAELEFQKPGREFLLKTALSKLQDRYDFIIIDTPPALNILTVNAYVATDGLIIPMAPEVLSLLGVSQIKETIDSVREYYNSRVFQTKIRNSVSVAAAPAHGISIVDYSPHSKPSQDYECLCDELAGAAFPRRTHQDGPGRDV